MPACRAIRGMVNQTARVLERGDVFRGSTDEAEQDPIGSLKCPGLTGDSHSSARSRPVKLMNTDPSVPHLEDAAYGIGAKSTFRDERNRSQIQLSEKVGASYKVLINSW